MLNVVHVRVGCFILARICSWILRLSFIYVICLGNLRLPFCNLYCSLFFLILYVKLEYFLAYNISCNLDSSWLSTDVFDVYGGLPRGLPVDMFTFAFCHTAPFSSSLSTVGTSTTSFYIWEVGSCYIEHYRARAPVT